MACSLYVLLARRARRAVVFRRGPTKQVLLLTWDLSKDRLEAGQWLKARIYERRCDLSPDGERLVYFAASWKKPFESWTAVSRPPWLTALALWPKGDAWGGGGLFANEHDLLLNPPLPLAEGFRLPSQLKTRSIGDWAGRGENDPIQHTRLVRDGWTLEQVETIREHSFTTARIWLEFNPPRIYSKPSPTRPEVVLRELTVGHKERGGRSNLIEHTVGRREETVPLGRTDWADWDTNGDLLFSREGSLFRLPLPAKAGVDPSAATLVADLSPLTFEARPPPPNYGW